MQYASADKKGHAVLHTLFIIAFLEFAAGFVHHINNSRFHFVVAQFGVSAFGRHHAFILETFESMLK